MLTKRRSPSSPSQPRLRLSIGVTGHREDNAAFVLNRARIAATLEDVFDQIDAAVRATPPPFGPGSIAATRLHTLLAGGTDQIGAHAGLARGWELVAPLPFGHALYTALNAAPATPADARALLEGHDAADSRACARAQDLRTLISTARTFELAERDDTLTAMFLTALEAAGDIPAAQAFAAATSERAALAARVMIEQSDIVVAVWDGVSQFFVGGTGHTIATALELGAPVVLIEAQAPEGWRVLRAPEALANPRSTKTPREAQLASLQDLVRAAMQPMQTPGDGKPAADPYHDAKALGAERWRRRSNPLWHAYRRVEAVFGNARPLRSLRQKYEAPDAVGTGSGAAMLAALRTLPDGDASLAGAIEAAVLRRFAWTDAIASSLSDNYRGGMTMNFVLSALAIFAGVSYLPFLSGGSKWVFSVAEFVLLATILCITWFGRKRRWHARWFETRRVAEYLRHSPILLALGVARAPGRWPTGSQTSWPEWYARHALREVGLPRVVVTQDYLRAALRMLLDDHVTRQRDYHADKSRRLTKVHKNLGRLSELFFQLAVSVVAVLALTAGGVLQLVPSAALSQGLKWFTLLGVVLPTLGAAISGIRYFGDFERFGAISEVTAGKLDALHARITLLLSSPDTIIGYERVSDLAHDADDVVVSEIENWQAVFGGKHVTVPA